MSKIICDVCGTSYPESAEQCPICGCARPINAQTILNSHDDAGEQESPAAYQYVRGGRFSNANVRKRNHAAQRKRSSAPTRATSAAKASGERYSASRKEKSGKGLVITAVVLFLCILAVVAYIVLRFFQPFGNLGTGFPGTGSSATEEKDTRPCFGISLAKPVVVLSAQGDTWQIEANTMPADTTDTIAYHSSDPSVVTIDDKGLMTAVGKGQAVITVTCGDVSAQCAVNCVFSEEGQPPVDVTDPTDAPDDPTEPPTESPTEEPTQPPTEEPTEPAEEFRLNRKDITFTRKDESWTLYSGKISLTKITWKSDDPSIAKIENGVVTAVGSGTTTVYGEYNGQTVSCIIRCNFTDNQGSSGGITEDGGGSGSASYRIKTQYGVLSSNDVTIKAGESLELSLVDGAGNSVSVSWTVSSGSACSASGSKITGVAAGVCTVSATYAGQTYTCTVRVSG